MSNEFRICNQCRGVNVTSLEKKLKEMDPNAKILIGCQNVCGIGRTKPFVIVNHKLVVGNTEEEVLEQVKKEINKNTD